MSYRSPGSYAGRRVFNTLFNLPASPPPPVAEIVQQSLTVTYGNGGAGDFSATMDITANPLFLDPTSAGNTAVIRFATNAFATVTNFVDNLGGSLVGGEWSIATVQPPGSISNIDHYAYRHNAPAGLTTFTMTKSSPFTALRMYFTEVAGLLNAAPVVTSGDAGASVSVSNAAFSASAGDFVASMNAFSPSRTPQTSDMDALLQRLNFFFFGGNWFPYTGAVSEYGMVKIATASGSQSLDSFWSDGNTSAEWSAAVFAVAP